MTTETDKNTVVGGPQYTRRMSPETSAEYMGHLFSVLAGSGETGGRFGLMELVAPKSPGPSRHLHYHNDEGYYVLEGNMTFYVGDETYEGGLGRWSSCPTAYPTRSPSIPMWSARSSSSCQAGSRRTS